MLKKTPNQVLHICMYAVPGMEGPGSNTARVKDVLIAPGGGCRTLAVQTGLAD
jgi:hypothetical protein